MWVLGLRVLILLLIFFFFFSAGFSANSASMFPEKKKPKRERETQKKKNTKDVPENPWVFRVELIRGERKREVKILEPRFGLGAAARAAVHVVHRARDGRVPRVCLVIAGARYPARRVGARAAAQHGLADGNAAPPV
jgi:Na+-transporting methylmalonyl-CoA/oxaloacetate decarboxylase gamma subunit